ncbi:hypothetical protein [Clostridium cagae]|uniref:hypothetical protein n=1 Tax=Clostridium cagae TaxID=2080751 RepID=UPI000CF71524|nr:hypothetical protein [Clostridium cagae]
MAGQKIVSARYIVNNELIDIKEPYDIDKIEYDEKYKGHLMCINGCQARVKFTQRNNKKHTKFFSNWNGDGKKHDKYCPYNVEYKGKEGRKKLEALYDSLEVNDDKIEQSIQSRASRLRKKYKGIPINNGEKHTTKKIDNDGDGYVDVSSDKVDVNNTAIAKRGYIQGMDANYLSTIDIGRTLCVYGIIDNVQFEQDEKSLDYYGYLNLKNRNYTVSILFSKSFYTDTNITEEEFKILMEILKNEINGNSENKNFVVFAYGKITRKSKKGLNINVNNPRHLLINDMKMKDILYTKKINNIDYTIK